MNNNRKPKISFVIIVLNGMPFIEYAIKAIYDFAHEIIIIEGAVENCLFAAGCNGSSKDGTVEMIKSFPDTKGIMRLIQGTWNEKVDMHNKALEYVTGNYVWLIDSDEIYKAHDVSKVVKLLEHDTTITQINFIGDNFWKGFDYIFVAPRFFETSAHFRRVFKFEKGAQFTSHRPPKMTYANTEVTTEEIHLVNGYTTRKMGIIPYHYSYVLNEQVKQKVELYKRYGWGKSWGIDLDEWYQECFMKWTPENREIIERNHRVWVGSEESYTKPFNDTHPEVMTEYIRHFNMYHKVSCDVI
ncbi:MAG: glycosyltransferase [Candidatus Omnitrophica bacterium]|nr:glycosyltransferase [Candidatus Omnitrophota bacterium]